jgi:hypothetical protein
MGVSYNKKERCWRVSISRKGLQRIQEYFSARDYGSNKKAHERAIKRFESLLLTLPPKQTTKNILTARNKSGVVGVMLDKKITIRSKKTYSQWRWIAFWPGAAKTIAWTVSPKKYSDNDAFVLAVLTRTHETTDRKFILIEFAKIRETITYKQILAKKNQKVK